MNTSDAGSAYYSLFWRQYSPESVEWIKTHTKLLRITLCVNLNTFGAYILLESLKRVLI